MTVKAIHSIDPKELEKGYFKDIHEVFEQFGTDHNFDSAHFTYVDGSEYAYEKHTRGQVHTHREVLGRVDGLKTGFDNFLTDPPVVEVWVDENVLYIKELNLGENHSTDEAARLRAMIAGIGK